MFNLISKMIRKLIFSSSNGHKSAIQSPLLKMIYPIKTVHILPNRVRFFVPVIKNNEGSCKILQEQLNKISAIQEVTVTPITGSVIAQFDGKTIEPEIIFAAIIKILGLEEELEKKPDPAFTKEMRFVFRSLDRAVYSQTNGVLDLSNVVTILLCAGAGKQLLAGKLNLPPAVTLFWWALSKSLKSTE